MTHSGLSADTALNLSRTKLGVLVAIMLELLMVALDQRVVGTALPKIVTDLNGSALYTGAVTVHVLMSTDSDPIFGNLSDLPFDEINPGLANGGAGDRRSTMLRSARDGGVRWF
jgi:hypothetical protein